MLLALATAVPSASPSPEPLKTIVTVSTSPFCGAFAAHVNSAIDSAVTDDRNLGSIILTLRAHDLAGNGIARRNEMQRLTTLADTMYRAYRSGEGEVNRLRDLAKTAKNKSERTEIKASADALGGALYRQHLIQRDLDGFVAYLQAADMRRGSDAEETQNEAIFGNPNAHYAAANLDINGRPLWVPPDAGREMEHDLVSLPGDESTATDAALALKASRDFERRLPAILRDELTAGARIAKANEHC